MITDNWTKLGPLYMPDHIKPRNIKLKDVLLNGECQEENCDVEWNEEIGNIVTICFVVLCPRTSDEAIWTADSKGKFSISTA